MTTETQELIWQIVVVLIVTSILITHVAVNGWLDRRYPRQGRRAR